MIAVGEFYALALKDSAYLVLGFSGHDGGTLTVALTALYGWNRDAGPTGKLRL